MTHNTPESDTANQLLGLLVQGQPVNGMLYSNALLHGSELNDTYDPNIVVVPRTISYAVPTSGMVEYDGTFATCAIGNKDTSKLHQVEEMQASRRDILGASIGTAALGRYSQTIDDISQLDRSFRFGIANDQPTANDMCRMLGIPVGAILIHTVVESTEVPVGSRVANLYFPLMVAPKTSLRLMQHAVRQMIQHEKSLLGSED